MEAVGKYRRCKSRMRHPFRPYAQKRKRSSNDHEDYEDRVSDGEGRCACGHLGTSSSEESVVKPAAVGGDRGMEGEDGSRGNNDETLAGL